MVTQTGRGSIIPRCALGARACEQVMPDDVSSLIACEDERDLRGEFFFNNMLVLGIVACWVTVVGLLL
ncbi:MAG TPA: hypothetical protein VF463_06080 [Sphingobium sp.]